MIIKISTNKLRWLFGLILSLWKELIAVVIMSGLTYFLYEFYDFKTLGLRGAIPIGVMGTALSLFLGFRNNEAYDRWWEARKIWGGIVNYSRTFAIQVLTYITQHQVEDEFKQSVKKIQQQLIYRHLAYINALRLALREQHDLYATELAALLNKNELQQLLTKANKPTQLNYNQSKQLKKVLRDDLIQDFRMYEIMQSLEEFYNLQGKCERIKKTPFPMYYDFFIKVFIVIFLMLLPVSLIGILDDVGKIVDANINWLVVPITLIVAFMFIIIEQTGRYTETPFANAHQDIAMTALCRTIEIDLREMLEEENIPLPLEPIKIFGDGEVLY